MLRLTKRADYGLIAMRHLAEQGRRGSCSAKDLAESHGIPPQLLAKILQRLVRAGLLASQHGIHGGYVLARDPARISALQVIQAIEGPTFLTSCVTGRGACGQASRCTVRGALRMVSRSIEGVLARISILDMGQPEWKEVAEPDEELLAIKSMD